MLIRRVTTVTLGFALLASTALAQETAVHKAQLEKDAVEIQHNTLTIDTVTRLFVSMGAMRDAVKADPELQKQEAANSAKDEGQSTLDQISDVLSRSPKIVAILASHGFTPRSFALNEMSVILTGIAAAAVEGGASMSDAVSGMGANEANLKLFIAHKAELDELSKKYPLQNPS